MRIHNRKRIALMVMASLLLAMLPVTSAQGSEATMIYSLNNPRVSNGVSTWDCIYFGNYWQEDTNGDGVADKNDTKTPIKWRVLSIDGDDAFLMADKNLDAQQYNKEAVIVLWKTSTLRSWMNGYQAESNESGVDYTSDNFLDNAFTEVEQKAIPLVPVMVDDNAESEYNTIDKVYVPSVNEVKNAKYGFGTDMSIWYDDTKIAENTAYVAAGGELGVDYLPGEGRPQQWWLRSPATPFWRTYSVGSSGTLSIDQVDQYEVAVRPVLHLDLSHTNVWTYAGTVSRGNETIRISTPSPEPTLEVTEKSIKPAKVKKLTVKAKRKKLQVKWKKTAWAKGYEVSVSTSKKFKQKDKLIASNNTKKTKITIKNLKRKKRYYVRVRAYTMWNNQKIYGKWSKVTKVKMK